MIRIIIEQDDDVRSSEFDKIKRMHPDLSDTEVWASVYKARVGGWPEVRVEHIDEACGTRA